MYYFSISQSRSIPHCISFSHVVRDTLALTLLLLRTPMVGIFVHLISFFSSSSSSSHLIHFIHFYFSFLFFLFFFFSFSFLKNNFRTYLYSHRAFCDVRRGTCIFGRAVARTVRARTLSKSVLWTLWLLFTNIHICVIYMKKIFHSPRLRCCCCRCCDCLLLRSFPSNPECYFHTFKWDSLSCLLRLPLSLSLLLAHSPVNLVLNNNNVLLWRCVRTYGEIHIFTSNSSIAGLVRLVFCLALSSGTPMASYAIALYSLYSIRHTVWPFGTHM